MLNNRQSTVIFVRISVGNELHSARLTRTSELKWVAPFYSFRRTQKTHNKKHNPL